MNKISSANFFDIKIDYTYLKNDKKTNRYKRFTFINVH